MDAEAYQSLINTQKLKQEQFSRLGGRYKHIQNDIDVTDVVYLDNAGSALYSDYQIRQASQYLQSTLLGNPRK